MQQPSSSVKYFTVALDRIQFSNVLSILGKKDMPKRCIKYLNTNNITKIKVSRKLTKDINTNVGIHQEGSLSPFPLKIIKTMEAHGIGYRLVSFCDYPILCSYAVLIAEWGDYLQRLLHTFKPAVKNYKTILSPSMIKLMEISKEPLRSKLAVNDSLIEHLRR